MTRKPTKALLVVGCMGLAFGLGTLNGNTETKFVRVPVYKTKVIESTTSSPSAQAVIPQSCLEALALTQKLGVANSTITKAAGDILNTLSDVERDAVTDDVASMNKNLSIIRENKIILGEAVISDTEIRLQINEKLATCQAKMKGE